MRIGRWCIAILCVCVAASGAARGKQVDTPRRAESPARQAGSTDIVVTGAIDRKPGEWKRAESDHVIVIGRDGAAELTRIARNLGLLHGLMTRLFRHGDTRDEVVKMQVTLIGSSATFRTMAPRNQRWEPAPYPAALADDVYYDPREDGEILSLARNDQAIDLNTLHAANRDCDDAIAGGASQCSNVAEAVHQPATRSWEALLYSAFAQHFILTYDPATYPRWYLDGIGALFSTIEVHGNGAVDYACAPPRLKQFLRAYDSPSFADVVTGRYLDDPVQKARWTPYHAWLLAHYFLYSPLRPERAKQFRQYMTEARQGVPLAEAARAFGDLRTLERELVRYGDDDDKYYAQGKPPETAVAAPTISTLPEASAALVEARIELDTRVAALAASAQGGAAPAAASEAQLAADWLTQVRGVLQLPYDAEAVLFAAEAECRSGHPAECLADAEHVLAHAPDNVPALAWKGTALTDQALAGPALSRATTLAAARATLERAIGLDDAAPLALIAYFQSFAKAGERVPDQAMIGMARVIRGVPAAPAPRLYLAQELLRQGKAELARRVADIVLHGPYPSPERSAAEALFATGDATRAAGRGS